MVSFQLNKMLSHKKVYQYSKVLEYFDIATDTDGLARNIHPAGGAEKYCLICNVLRGYHPSQRYFVDIFLFHIAIRYPHRLRPV